jgi:hypothetical protein
MHLLYNLITVVVCMHNKHLRCICCNHVHPSPPLLVKRAVSTKYECE